MNIEKLKKLYEEGKISPSEFQKLENYLAKGVLKGITILKDGFIDFHFKTSKLSEELLDLFADNIPNLDAEGKDLFEANFLFCDSAEANGIEVTNEHLNQYLSGVFADDEDALEKINNRFPVALESIEDVIDKGIEDERKLEDIQAAIDYETKGNKAEADKANDYLYEQIKKQGK